MKMKIKRRMKVRRLRMNEGYVDSGFDECADFKGKEVDHELV